jgi:RND family efflux transporter MFP subunit
VEADEALTYTIAAGVDGWVRRVFSDQTGTRVKRGEILASVYSRDMSAPQQAYIYALESYERLRHASPVSAEPLALATQQLTTARENLLFVGMGERQVDELARTGRESYDLHLTAPVDGVILDRRAAVGQRFMKGESLYRLASLAHVWVLADIDAGSAAQAAAISRAQVRVQGMPRLPARVSPVTPRFDGQTRTGKLRLEVNDPRGILVPGMIVDVALYFATRAAITVHADSVVDSGAKQHVFVAHGTGAFEIREVETGIQEGDRVEILRGLEPGDRVVTEGAFLLDSESRLKNLDVGAVDAECGMKIDRARARRVKWNGAIYYFCSESCERKFAARIQ